MRSTSWHLVETAVGRGRRPQEGTFVASYLVAADIDDLVAMNCPATSGRLRRGYNHSTITPTARITHSSRLIQNYVRTHGLHWIIETSMSAWWRQELLKKCATSRCAPWACMLARSMGGPGGCVGFSWSLRSGFLLGAGSCSSFSTRPVPLHSGQSSPSSIQPRPLQRIASLFHGELPSCAASSAAEGGDPPPRRSRQGFLDGGPITAKAVIT